MYGFLRKVLPKATADALIIFWYILLIFLVIALSHGGHGEFRYLNI